MKQLLLTMGMAVCTAQSHAQDIRKENQQAFDDFRREIRQDFDNFRRQCMKEYIDFVEQTWKEFGCQPAKPVPKEDAVPPLVIPKPKDDKPLPIQSRPIVIEQVVAPPIILPQPLPLEPIKEVPVAKPNSMEFTFFGTQATVRYPKGEALNMDGVSEHQVANTLKRLAKADFDNTIIDCLALRKKHSLSDWAYLMMLRALSDTACGQGSNEAELLMAYLFMQSGYKMRIGMADGKLHMLYATSHLVYDKIPYELNGVLYYGMGQIPTRMKICEAPFPKEQVLSLLINTQQQLANAPCEKRTISSVKYNGFKVDVAVNKNLINFYATYPTSMLNGNVMTRWAQYANTPIDENVRQTLYPQLRALTEGMSQRDALNRVLNLIQTGLEYEYDDKVWGDDRAFFAEESLFYPFCDCEDRSILFTRIVRDLFGLKCLLVFYPRHLAAAVALTEPDVPGDYILLDGEKYIVADGTLIGYGKDIGVTMKGMDNATAKVIVLE